MHSIAQRPLSIRLIALALALATAAVIAGPASHGATAQAAVTTPVENGTKLWTVDASNLGLRAGPGNHHPVTVKALEDTHVVATGSHDGAWVEVSLGGTRAWTVDRFLTSTKPAWDKLRVIVKNAEVAVRSTPEAASGVAARAVQGDEGFFTGIERNGFWQVKLGGVFGWVAPGDVDTATSAPWPQGSSKWTTRASNLGLRVGPGNDYPVNVRAVEDTFVRATGLVSGRWVQVWAGGIAAWTPDSFVTSVKPPWDPITVAVKTPNLGMRSGPSNDYPVRVEAPYGTTGRFTGVKVNGWWEVKFQSRFVWTPGKYLAVGGIYEPNTLLRISHSQVGYREPAWRDNPYNDWIGADNAWCAVFVAWAFDRAGYDGFVPRTAHFDDYVAELRRSGVLDTDVSAGDINRGDVVLIDWPPHNGPTHTGIVDHVDGNGVWLVEGNTTDGSGDPTRGVFYRYRYISDVYAVFDPVDYRNATY